MEKTKNFFELEVWKLGHRFVLEIYELTKKFPKEEQFGITSQIRRAASSITANIAEGYGRHFFRDKINFYYISRASCAEACNFLFISRDLNLLNEKKFKDLDSLVNDINKMINAMIKYLENKANKK